MTSDGAFKYRLRSCLKPECGLGLGCAMGDALSACACDSVGSSPVVFDEAFDDEGGALGALCGASTKVILVTDPGQDLDDEMALVDDSESSTSGDERHI